MAKKSKARTTPVPYGARFGRLVRRLRNARGLTQEALAERANLAADTIRRMEHGSFSPSLETLAKLVVGLDTSLSTLFTAFEGSDDATTREILSMGRRMTGPELVLAVRVLSLLAAMLRILHAGTDDAPDQTEAPR
jgi:transcriptional regulator with XRE-family HTH domain